MSFKKKKVDNDKIINMKIICLSLRYNFVLNNLLWFYYEKRNAFSRGGAAR